MRVAALLPMPACIDAIERAFIAHATGDLPATAGRPRNSCRERRFSRQDRRHRFRTWLLRRQDQCEFPGQCGAARAAGDPGPDRPLRRGVRPRAGRHGFDRDHDTSHRGRQRDRRATPRAQRCFNPAGLRLRQPGPGARPLPCARAPAAPGPRIRQGPQAAPLHLPTGCGPKPGSPWSRSARLPRRFPHATSP